MGIDIVKATILFDDKPQNVDELRLVFTKTNKKITKRNYIDSVVFPPLVKNKSGWFSTITPLDPSGAITHIDEGNVFGRVISYPEQLEEQSATLTLITMFDDFE